MFFITNRTLNKNQSSLKLFGDTPNPLGPNELRLVQVSKKGNSWSAKAVPDKLSAATAKSLKQKFKLDIDLRQTWPGSLKVACELFEQATKEKKSIVFFVHGYNNDVKDVLKAATEIEALYNVIVVPFTWPANGGGKISGTLSYLSDKSDARASSGAFNRTVDKIQKLHYMLTEARKRDLQQQATEKHKNNPQAAAELFSKLMEKNCVTNISLICHSMGNYVLKHTLATSENATSRLVFDNICLVAADTNADKHDQWVGKLDVRSRVYVVVNENDFALKASRVKPGDAQKTRLGHTIKHLNSSNAHYIDVSNARHVDSDHSYFKGPAIKKNQELRDVFNALFNGSAIEHKLIYRSDNNSYTLLNHSDF